MQVHDILELQADSTDEQRMTLIEKLIDAACWNLYDFRTMFNPAHFPASMKRFQMLNLDPLVKTQQLALAVSAIARGDSAELQKVVDWREGRAPILKALLKSGLDPNATSLGTNRTPLQYAVEMGDEDSARLLSQYGTDVNATIPQSKGKNHTPLLLAVQRRQISLIRLLLENGAHRTYRWKGKRFQVHTDARIHHVQRALGELGELGLAVEGEYYIPGYRSIIVDN